MANPIPPRSTLVPLAQWEQLTDEQKVSFADELFAKVMYGVSDLRRCAETYGFPDNGGDLVPLVDGLFEKYGVHIPEYVTEDEQENLRFRFTTHNTADGQPCGWSLVGVEEPLARPQRGNLRCPAGCPDSSIETAPHVAF